MWNSNWIIKCSITIITKDLNKEGFDNIFYCVIILLLRLERIVITNSSASSHSKLFSFFILLIYFDKHLGKIIFELSQWNFLPGKFLLRFIESWHNYCAGIVVTCNSITIQIDLLNFIFIILF